jgi:hypothetical protein
MIDLPPTWRLVLFVAAVGLLPTLVFVQWAARQLAHSILGARLRGWWQSSARRCLPRQPPGMTRSYPDLFNFEIVEPLTGQPCNGCLLKLPLPPEPRQLSGAEIHQDG